MLEKVFQSLQSRQLQAGILFLTQGLSHRVDHVKGGGVAHFHHDRPLHRACVSSVQSS